MLSNYFAYELHCHYFELIKACDRIKLFIQTLQSHSYIILQLGSAVMLQCPLTGHIIGANAGYLYGVSFSRLFYFLSCALLHTFQWTMNLKAACCQNTKFRSRSKLSVLFESPIIYSFRFSNGHALSC